MALSVVSTASLLFLGWTTLGADSRAPGSASAPSTDTDGDGQSAAGPPAALVVLQGPDGRAVSTTVLVPDGDGGGNLLFVPVGTMVEVPSFGLDSVGAALDLGGLPLLQQSVENLLGVRFDQVSLLDTAAVETLVRPAGTLTVDLPEPVEYAGAEGQTVRLEAGATGVPPEQVAQVLSAPAPDGELSRLVRHQAFWTAWLAELDVAPAPAGPSSAPALPALLSSLAAGEVRFHTLPVESLGTGSQGEGALYRFDRADVRKLTAELFPDGGGTAERLRVRLLNGTGAPGLAQLVAPRLVEAGAEATLVGNADRFDYTTTQVVYYDDEHRADAQEVRDALGVGEVVFGRRPIGVVEMTVVVGGDFVAVSTAS